MQTGVAIRRSHRARLPDRVSAADADGQRILDLGSGDGRQLWLEQGAFPVSGARRQPRSCEGDVARNFSRRQWDAAALAGDGGRRGRNKAGMRRRTRYALLWLCVVALILTDSAALF